MGRESTVSSVSSVDILCQLMAQDDTVSLLHKKTKKQ